MTHTKSLLLVALLTVGLVMGPVGMAGAQGMSAPEAGTRNQIDGMVGAMGGLFGMFGGFGASGEVFGRTFQLMFQNIYNLTSTQKLPGVYVMNASVQNPPVRNNYVYGSGERDIWIVPAVYSLANATEPAFQDEFAYVYYENNGSVDVTITEGASLTFIIWDNDGSFIAAIDKVISALQQLNAIDPEDAQAEAQAVNIAFDALTYLLIHINDIINGDEVIILQMTGYTNYNLDFTGNYELIWYASVNHSLVMEDQYKLDNVMPGWHAEFNNTATAINDETMLFVLNDAGEAFQDIEYTRFSYDILQLWLKHFEVHVDVEAILAAMTAVQEGQSGDPFQGRAIEDIFNGLDIEFYLMTHHLMDFFLYDDSRYDSAIYAPEVQALANNGVPDVVWETVGEHEGKPVEKIVDSEITHYFVPRGIENVEFLEPTYDLEKGSMSWGVRANNVNFRLIPVGMTPNNCPETAYPIVNMEYFELGFTFAPTKAETVENQDFINAAGTTTMGAARVKLDQKFGKWTNMPSYVTTGHDLSVVYISTILHVHLHIENGDFVPDPYADDELLSAANYKNESHSIKVGNAMADNPLPLAAIDIAGPSYTQSDGTTTDTHNASTTIVPLAFAGYYGQASQTYLDSTNETNVISGMLTIEISIMAYAVSYPTWDGSGDELIHDPTFTIYLTFTNPGVLAIILVVGVVGLVGLAAVFITKRKQSAFL